MKTLKKNNGLFFIVLLISLLLLLPCPGVLKGAEIPSPDDVVKRLAQAPTIEELWRIIQAQQALQSETEGGVRRQHQQTAVVVAQPQLRAAAADTTPTSTVRSRKMRLRAIRSITSLMQSSSWVSLIRISPSNPSYRSWLMPPMRA